MNLKPFVLIRLNTHAVHELVPLPVKCSWSRFIFWCFSQFHTFEIITYKSSNTEHQTRVNGAILNQYKAKWIYWRLSLSMSRFSIVRPKKNYQTSACSYTERNEKRFHNDIFSHCVARHKCPNECERERRELHSTESRQFLLFIEFNQFSLFGTMLSFTLWFTNCYTLLCHTSYGLSWYFCQFHTFIFQLYQSRFGNSILNAA